MRTLILCLIPIAAHGATTVYQASVDQLTVVHGVAAPDSAVHRNAPKSLRVEPGRALIERRGETAPEYRERSESCDDIRRNMVE